MNSESKSIRKLRAGLVKELPKFPNNKSTTEVLKNKSLPDQLIHYLAWRIHFVSTRPRIISIDPTAASDPTWGSLSANIQFFLDKVEHGIDLTPHLSLKPKMKGYSPTSDHPSTANDRWEDKYFLPNVMGI